MKTCPFLKDQMCNEWCQLRTVSGQCQIAEAAEAQKQTAKALAQIAKALCRTEKS